MWLADILSSCSYFGLLKENGFLNRPTIHHLDLWKLQATCNKRWFELLRSNTLKISFHHMSISAYSNPFNLSCQTGARKMVYKKKQNRIHEPQCRNGNYVKTATQLLSATPATLLLYLLDWHASKVLHLPRKTQEWPPSAKAWSGKKTFRAKLPPVLTVPSWKSTISFVLYWLLRSFLHFFKMLPLPRLLTLCRAGGRKNANATSTHVTKRNQKHAICEEIDVQHIRRITCLSQFASAAQRWGLATSLRVTLPGCGRSSNPGRTWLQPPDIPRLCPKQLPGCLGRITAGCLVLYSEVGVWNRTCRKWKSTYWLLFWDPYHGLS